MGKVCLKKAIRLENLAALVATEEATQSDGERVGVDYRRAIENEFNRFLDDDRHLQSSDNPTSERVRLSGFDPPLNGNQWASTGTSGKGAREDVGQGAKLELCHLRQRHVVKDRAVREVQLLEEEAPVQAGLLSLVVDLRLNVGLLKTDGAVGLLANEGDVVLWKAASAKFLRAKSWRKRAIHIPRERPAECQAWGTRCRREPTCWRSEAY